MMQENERPLISIYVPCHNYGRFLRQAIESVFCQLYQNWELFIIDDGSTDDTAGIAGEYASKDPYRVTFIHNPSPLGLQKIANSVLRAAKGKYIMRLDGDDWLDECALLVMVARALQQDEPALVFGNYYYVNEQGHIIGLERPLTPGGEERSRAVPPHGACTLVRTRALRAMGGYSEDINAQDGWELWFKLARRSNTASVSTPVFFYRQHGNSLSQAGERLYNARVQIFSRLREKQQGSYLPRVLAVLPVRESYPHFEGVPYTELGGISLLQRAIADAQSVPMVTEVLVSSDSLAVVDFSASLERKGAVRPHLRVVRPAELNGEHIHLQRILEHAGKFYCESTGVFPDVILFLSLHAVARAATSIAKAIDTLLVTESDTVVSVVEERQPVFVHADSGLRLIGNGRFDNLFHRNEQVLRFNGSVIADWWDVIEGGALWGKRIGYIEMTAEESQTLTERGVIPRIERILERRNLKNYDARA